MNRRTMFSFNGFAFLPTVFVCVITFSQALSGQQWGPENNGFQMRIIAVDPGSDEQTPVIDESVATVNSFESAADVTLVAEIKNISTQEIRYVGVRYGDNVTSGHVGRSNTDFFGPLFFRCELKDSQGNPIERLGGSNDERLNIVEHSYENVSLLKAGESALLQLHPLRWDLAQQEQVLEGDYKIQIKYLGAEIQESCWNGELLSQEIAIKINGPEKDARPDLQWGEPKDKIRVAARYRLSDQRAENEEEFVSSTFPQESKVDVEFFIQNISTQTIEIESADWRQDDQVFLVTAAGEQLQQGAWYSGISPRKTFRLGPKQTAIIPSICIGFSADKATAEFSHPIGVVLEGQSGVFRVAHALSLRVRKSSEEGADEQAFDTLQV